MSFNEISAVENFVIYTMMGENLNGCSMAHEAATPNGVR